MEKKTYRYELHCHTSEGSGCSRISAKEMVDYYLELGYDGIVITDHFTGQTTVPKFYGWTDRISFFYENGFRKAQEYGQQKGLKVFFGLEWSAGGNDFLLLGPDKDWWMQQGDFFRLGPNQVFDRVHEGGGYVIHAHPFAEARWIECIRLFPRKVDAVEIFNGGCPLCINERAYWYAQSYQLKMTGGTDTHTNREENHCGVETLSPCETLEQLIKSISDGSAKPFSTSQGEELLGNRG